MSPIRRAEEPDLDAIGDLAEARRQLYRRYQPVFWRPASDGRTKQLGFLRRQLASEGTLAFVHHDAGQLDAFAIGVLLPTADGLIWLIDDFAVQAPALWSSAGAAILDAVLAAARDRGADQIVAITAHLDEPKRALLASGGFTVDSGWHVRAHAAASAEPHLTASASAGPPRGVDRPAVRQAGAADAPGLLRVAEGARAPYQRYQRTFWRRAGTTREGQIEALSTLAADPNVVGRVHAPAGGVDAYAFGTVMPAPPVYDPGGPVCLVDDFVFPATAPSIGAALLEDVSQAARSHGAVLTIAICPELDAPKRALLADRGFSLASEWWIRPL